MKRHTSLLLATFALATVAQAQQVSITPELAAAVGRYDIVQSFSDGMAPVCKQGKWGYIDARGQEAIACQVPATYDLFVEQQNYGFVRDESYVRDFHDGMVAIAREVGGAKSGYERQLRWAYFNAAGQQVTDYVYDTAGDFACGLAWVTSDTFTGFIDKTGRQVIDGAKYALPDVCYTFSEGLCAVGTARVGEDCDLVEWGYINTQGQEVIPCRYEQTKPFSCGLAAVATATDDFDALYPVSYSYLRPDGTVAFTMPSGKECGTFSDGLATVTTDGQKFGFIDTTGTKVLAENYFTDDTAMPAVMASYSEGYTLVGPSADGFRLMDKSGTVGSVAVLGAVHQGVALCAGEGGKLGFVRPDGTVAVACAYDSAPVGEGGTLDMGKGCYRFTPEGVAAVRKAGKWGYTDLTGHDTF